MDKSSIRRNMNTQRKQLSRQQIEEYSRQIADTLYQHPKFQSCNAIYTYASYKEEVLTDAIIEYARSQNKKVAVPKVFPEGIEFFYINGKEDMVAGYQGIPEPVHTDNQANDLEVLLLMPGLAFDREHNRIGYGGGYYDRYLEAHNHMTFYKIAVAFDFQIMEHIDCMEYDKKVDCIITPTKII